MQLDLHSESRPLPPEGGERLTAGWSTAASLAAVGGWLMPSYIRRIGAMCLNGIDIFHMTGLLLCCSDFSSRFLREAFNVRWAIIIFCFLSCFNGKTCLKKYSYLTFMFDVTSTTFQEERWRLLKFTAYKKSRIGWHLAPVGLFGPTLTSCQPQSGAGEGAGKEMRESP